MREHSTDCRRLRIRRSPLRLSAAGDRRGDEEERRALEGIEAPVTRTRGQLGETLAAGPAIDLVLAVAALERGAPGAGPANSGVVLASSLSGTVGAVLVGAAS